VRRPSGDWDAGLRAAEQILGRRQDRAAVEAMLAYLLSPLEAGRILRRTSPTVNRLSVSIAPARTILAQGWTRKLDVCSGTIIQVRRGSSIWRLKRINAG